MKIRQERHSPGTGGGMSEGNIEYRVIEWPDGQSLPRGAEAVADSTPLSDWKKAESDKPKGEGGK